ncbi:MAG: thiamine biosynthesis protein [Thermodesulfatator sp.]|nr:MAG: thiamine biosynthesis protein [Thermodesulfatator sp.]
MQANCLVLYSGGLDSILACKVLEEQGIRPIALQCITPFFGYSLKGREHRETQRVMEKYSLELHVVDISQEYLQMVRNPPHGYGRHLNPCIDCKIIMVKKAISLMDKFSASFVASGEVLGQRPMSQRRDALRIIERDSGAAGLLLRPLSAGFLPETHPERNGLVDRNKLPGISGRGRKIQMALAQRYGIRDFPAPAGGCVLADPILSARFRKIFETWPGFTVADCLIARTGRHFLLEDKSWVIVGRNQKENIRLEKLAGPEDILLRPVDIPGPVCLVRYIASDKALDITARICARYSKGKGTEKLRIKASRQKDDLEKILLANAPCPDMELETWRF